MTDSPKVFNLDAVKDEAGHEPFHFTYKGVRAELPHQGDIDAFGMFDAFAAGKDEAVASYEAMLRELGPEKVAALRKVGLPLSKFQALTKAWNEHSGLDAGE